MVVIFLPAYNEELALPRLVEKLDIELKKAGESYRLVVLDDGSSDNTTAVAQSLSGRYPLTLLRHDMNQGLGRTMIDGLRHVCENTTAEDLVVTLDCDDTHEPRYLPAALEKVRAGHDVVILSRFTPGGGSEGLSPLKSFLSGGAGFFLRIFFPIKGVKEYSCNYRVYRASILQKAQRIFGDGFISLPDKGFVAPPEILVKMRMLGARIAESPFVLRYDQKPTPSSHRPLKTIAGYMHLVRLYLGRKAPVG